MPTLAPCRAGSRTESTFESNYPIFADTYEEANGPNGIVLKNAKESTFRQWRNGSIYVMRIVPIMAETRLTADVDLVIALTSLAVCAGTIAIGLATDFGNYIYPFSIISGLAAYTMMAKWISHQDHNTRLLWTVERLRRIVGVENDIGSRQ